VEWTLETIQKVVYKRASYEKGQCYALCIQLWRVSKLDNNLVLPGELISAIVPMYGAGDYDNITFAKNACREEKPQ